MNLNFCFVDKTKKVSFAKISTEKKPVESNLVNSQKIFGHVRKLNVIYFCHVLGRTDMHQWIDFTVQKIDNAKQK